MNAVTGKYSVNGNLMLNISPSGKPESFSVSGFMSGSAMGTIPFKGIISGSMGCTTLSVSLQPRGGERTDHGPGQRQQEGDPGREQGGAPLSQRHLARQGKK